MAFCENMQSIGAVRFVCAFVLPPSASAPSAPMAVRRFMHLHFIVTAPSRSPRLAIDWRAMPSISATLLLLSAVSLFGADADRLLRVDHYVGVRSAVPAISGQMSEIYVRE